MIHEELNQARIDQKKVAESLNVKQRSKLFGSLKGSKYITSSLRSFLLASITQTNKRSISGASRKC